MSRHWIAGWAALAALLAQGATEVAAGAQAVPRIAFHKYQLPNGLDVILVEDHRLPLVAVNLWYHVGPANERPGRTGFAHLFEHMMFQGSGHVPNGSHIALLEGAGATDLNGTTDFDRTNYFETVPSNQLELALWLESDRMGFLLDTLDQSKLTRQKDVVRNERRQSIENRPYGLVDEELFHQLYPPGHPYHADVIGSHADIEAARLEDVRSFFSQYYVPNNASLAIVGDFDEAQARALVGKYFGPIARGAPVPRIDARTPPITSEKRVTVTDRVELPRVSMAWLTPPIYQRGDAEADLLAEILGGGKSSRLYKRLVYERQIAQDVSADQQSLALGSVFEIAATANPGNKPEALARAIDEEVAAIAATAPTRKELERARNSMTSQIIRGLERLGGFGGIADRLNRYNHYLGDPDFLAQDLARYQSVTPAAIRELAAHALVRNARVVIYGVPGERIVHDVPRGTAAELEAAGKASSADSASDWRSKTPAPGPPSPLTLPVPQRFALPNGLTVLLLEQHQLPVVAANLVVLSGSDANPPGEPGLAAFTADMLREGTTRRSALAIADDTAQIGALLTTSSTSDYSSIEVRTLTSQVDAAFDLLADVTLRPAFAPQEIERVRSARLTQLQQQRDSPNAIASRVLNAAIYGAEHPYGSIELGTRASLEKLTREQLVEFWRRGYVPGKAALVVAGDLSQAELERLASKHFGAWSGAASRSDLPALQPRGGRRIIVVDRGQSPQTALRVGAVGVARSDPDYVPLAIMNAALGGIFTSRINLNLREKHGYTYGASSAFAFRRGPGPFTVGAGVRTDATAPAVKEIFVELERMRTEDLSADELKLARDALAQSLPGVFETTPQATRTIGNLFVYALPLDYYHLLPQWIQAVTAADVRRVAREHLHPEEMVVVAVGDSGRIAPELAGLALGSVEHRGLDD